MKILEQYGIEWISNKQFASYLNNRKLSISINGFNSDIDDVKCAIPQGSVLILFFPYLYYWLHLPFKYSDLYYFSDDNKLLNFNSYANSIKNK